MKMETSQEKPHLILVKSECTYKMKLDPHLDSIIRHLIARFPSTEFSGTLFYKAKGSFANKNLEIIGIDFFLQDIGTSAYTSFEQSPDVASYMIENDLLGKDIYQGLLHSHHEMGAFFSGTDLETIRLEGGKRSHFVSLVVDTEGTYTAVITRCCKDKGEFKGTTIYQTFNGVEVAQTIKYPYSREIVEYSYLDIERQNPMPFKSVDDRVSDLMKVKDSRSMVSSSICTSKSIHLNYSHIYDDLQVRKTDLLGENSNSKSVEPISKSKIEDIARRILSCNMFCNLKTSIEDTAKMMLPKVKRKFTIRSYEMYIGAILEIMIYYNKECNSFVVDRLLDMFRALPSDDYIKVIIRELTEYSKDFMYD